MFQRLLEVLDRLSERFEVLFLAEHEFAAAQHAIIGADIGGLGIGKPRFLGRTERDLERIDDPMRDVVLDLEDIGQIAVVAVGP